MEMISHAGSLGDFFGIRYNSHLTGPDFVGIPQALRDQMRDFHHKRINYYEAAQTWFSISAYLYGMAPYTLGNQWLTWRDEGFHVLFDFISVSFSVAQLC